MPEKQHLILVGLFQTNLIQHLNFFLFLMAVKKVQWMEKYTSSMPTNLFLFLQVIGIPIVVFLKKE
ncbi:hypothetical protein D932_01985 [Enterococcus casseliflavus 14-MB-W-14]|nr:hypothetical protein D932_01985 [Enterococcus casseliflavus 14-MB-W-14]